jgi:hypothetical protein
MAGSVSGRAPFAGHDRRQPSGKKVHYSAADPAAESPDKVFASTTRSHRSLILLMAEPEVHLLMRADGVDERQLLQVLTGLSISRSDQPHGGGQKCDC